jgi:transcriptional regulator with XRE-family HTH domain
MTDTFTLTYPTLPARLRLLREALGISREQLAASLTKRAPGNNVGRIERGVHNPTPRTLARLARGLGVNARFLAHGYRNTTGSSPMGWSIDEAFPARLRRTLRERALLPDDLMARLAHANEHTVMAMLKGGICPRPETVVNIAKALGVSAQFLASGVHHTVAMEDLTQGQRLLLVRHASQLSRADLAKEIGLDDTTTRTVNRTGFQTVCLWEHGRLRPTFKQLESVANALGVSLKMLSYGTEQPADSIRIREQRLEPAQQKVLEDFRFMFESGALSAADAAEFGRYVRKQLLGRIRENAIAA